MANKYYMFVLHTWMHWKTNKNAFDTDFLFDLDTSSTWNKIRKECFFRSSLELCYAKTSRLAKLTLPKDEIFTYSFALCETCLFRRPMTYFYVHRWPLVGWQFELSQSASSNETDKRQHQVITARFIVCLSRQRCWFNDNLNKYIRLSLHFRLVLPKVQNISISFVLHDSALLCRTVTSFSVM